MNILQVIASGGYGGREIQPVILSDEMKRLGYKTFLLVRNNSQSIPLIKKMKLPYFELKIGGYLNLASLFSLIKILKENNIDVIHTHVSKSLLFLHLAKILSKKKIKIIFTQRIGVNTGKNDFFHKMLYNHTDKIIAISEYVKRRLLESAPFLNGKIQVVYNGIQIDKKPQKNDKLKFLNEFKISKKDIIISLIGQLNEGKGHEWTIKALKLIKFMYKFNNFKVFFTGEGELKDKFKNLVNSENISDKVIFTGFRTDIDYFYRNSDIILVPSRAEAFGNVVIEAMVYSKPVICSNSGAFMEMITNDKSGIIVEYDNTGALAKAILLLIKKPELRNKLGMEAKKTVLSKFDYKDTVKNYLKLYQEP